MSEEAAQGATLPQIYQLTHSRGLTPIWYKGGPANQAWSVPNRFVVAVNKNKRRRSVGQPLSGLCERLQASGQGVDEKLHEVGRRNDQAWWSDYLSSTNPLLGEISDTDRLLATRNSFYDKTGSTRERGVCLRAFAVFVWHIGLSYDDKMSWFGTYLDQVMQSTEMHPVVTPEKVIGEQWLPRWEKWEAHHAPPCNTMPETTIKETDDFVKLIENSTRGLDTETVRVLGALFKSGEMSEGVDISGEGVGNGLCVVTLRVNNAPDEQRHGVSRGVTPPLWSRGTARIDHVTEVFLACASAGFPLLILKDAPIESVMGMAATDAIGRGYTGLGMTGRGSLYETQDISDEFVRSWTTGGAEESCIPYPWTIQDLEEDVSEGKNKLWSISSTSALEIHERTGMYKMCAPWRGGKWGKKGGEQTSLVSGEEFGTWGGSEVTVWAMPKGSITNPHFDMQDVSGTLFYAPAVGTVRSVRRDTTGSLKTAIVVSAHDRLEVQRVFRLDLHQIPSHQYKHSIRLKDFAKKLTENRIRFVVVDFPEDCSYFLPPGCAHMFETHALVESSGWLPSLKFWADNVDNWIEKK